MFKNRKVTVTLDKKTPDEQVDPTVETETLAKKADIILHRLEKIGVKVAIGVCAFVVLDTIRQVTVVRAQQDPIIDMD